MNEDEDEDRNRNTVRNESGDLDEFEIVTRESHPKSEAVVKRLNEREIKEENGTKSDEGLKKEKNEILKHVPVGITELIPGMYVHPLSQLYYICRLISNTGSLFLHVITSILTIIIMSHYMYKSHYMYMYTIAD